MTNANSDYIKQSQSHRVVCMNGGHSFADPRLETVDIRLVSDKVCFDISSKGVVLVFHSIRIVLTFHRLGLF